MSLHGINAILYIYSLVRATQSPTNPGNLSTELSSVFRIENPNWNKDLRHFLYGWALGWVLICFPFRSILVRVGGLIGGGMDGVRNGVLHTLGKLYQGLLDALVAIILLVLDATILKIMASAREWPIMLTTALILWLLDNVTHSPARQTFTHCLDLVRNRPSWNQSPEFSHDTRILLWAMFITLSLTAVALVHTVFWVHVRKYEHRWTRELRAYLEQDPLHRVLIRVISLRGILAVLAICLVVISAIYASMLVENL